MPSKNVSDPPGFQITNLLGFHRRIIKNIQWTKNKNSVDGFYCLSFVPLACSPPFSTQWSNDRSWSTENQLSVLLCLSYDHTIESYRSIPFPDSYSPTSTQLFSITSEIPSSSSCLASYTRTKSGAPRMHPGTQATSNKHLLFLLAEGCGESRIQKRMWKSDDVHLGRLTRCTLTYDASPHCLTLDSSSISILGPINIKVSLAIPRRCLAI